ncbi:TetR/AcrR family transcriptional regulator [Aeromicrobium sp. P5_D10]
MSLADRPLDEVLTASSAPIVFGSMLEAALNTFHEHGYGGSSVRDIANRVGVTVPALYYHHENKEAMLYALLEQSISRLHGLVADAAAATTPGSGRLDAMVEVLVRHTAVNGRLMFLDSELRSLTPEHREAYVGRRADIEHQVLQAVEDGIADGDFSLDHPRDAVRALLGMIQAIAAWFRPDGEMSVDALTSRYLTLSRRLIGGH